MNITFENAEKVSGVLTLVVEEADYAADVEKALKDYRKKANIPGFRPGMAPMGMIKRQIGASLKVDTINKLVGNKIYEYVKKKGWKYDAHHIQPLSMGGRNEASNITPLRYDIHNDHKGVHAPDSPYDKLEKMLKETVTNE